MTGKQKTAAPPTPRAPRTTRRTVDLAPDPLDAPARANDAPPATLARTTTRRPRRKPAVAAEPAPAIAPEPTPAAAEEPTTISNPDAKTGEEYPGEPTFKMTVNIPMSLHQRASGVVRNAEMTGEPEEIESLTDLVRNSLAELVARYEKKYNEGAPFPAPKRLRRGRRSAY